jgi:hypothetical protein
MFRFRLNDVLLNDQPIGWIDLVEAIVADENLHGFVLQYDGNLDFVGDGYAILSRIWIEGFCNSAELIIEQSCGEGYRIIAETTIVIADMQEDLERCVCSVSPIDNSFYAFIYNNRFIDVDMRAVKTKSGIDMDACPSMNLRVFLPELIETGDYIIVSNAVDPILNGLYYPDPLTGFYVQQGATFEVGGQLLPAFILTVFTPSPYDAQWSLLWWDGSSFQSIDVNISTPQNPAQINWPDGMIVGSIEYELEDRLAFDQRDVLEHILNFITDGKITQIQSTYLDTLEWELANRPTNIGCSFCLLSGAELRRHLGRDPLRVSFDKIINLLFKTNNIFWKISGTVMRIEPYSFWFEARGHEIDSIRGLTREIDTSKLYDKVECGSAKSIEDRDLVYSLPLFYLSAHAVQQYVLEGNCNTDVTLDLVSDITYDSNVIEHILVTQIDNEANNEDPDTAYDKDVIYIQYSEMPNGENIACYDTRFLRDTTPPIGLIYNAFLLNNEILARHTFHAAIIAAIGSQDDNMRVQASGANAFVVDFQDTTFTQGLTPSQGALFAQFFGGQWGTNQIPVSNQWGGATNVPIQFNNTVTPPNFDLNGNWDTSNYWYEAPVSGVYGFEFAIAVQKLYDRVKQIGFAEVAISDIQDPQAYYLSVEGRSIKIFMEVIDLNGDVVNSFQVFSYLYYNGEAINTFDSFPAYPKGGGISVAQLFNMNPANPNFNIWSIMTIQKAIDITQSYDPGVSLAITPLTRPSALIYLEQGYRMRPKVEILGGSCFRDPLTDEYRKVAFGISPSSFIRTTYVETGGGIIDGQDTNSHMCIKYNFERPLTLDVWEKIKEDPKAAIGIGVDLDLVDTFVSDIRRNFATGQCSFTNITNRTKLL